MTSYGNGTHIFELFPIEYVELNVEMAQKCHRPLHEKLAEAGCTMDDLDLKIALTASYCEVVMDDIYTLEDRIKLCKILKEKLILRRVPEKSQNIILPN